MCSHMDSAAELREQISQIEAEIEELAEIIESCRKLILIAKAAIIAGGVLILAISVGVIRFDPTVMIGAIAAIIGGSNTSTLKQTTSTIEAAKARRAELMMNLGAGSGMLQTTWSSSK
jgi:prefoldin subunit 5